MRLDRIVIDAWDWVRRVVWFRRNRVKTPPFIVIETFKGRFGILRRVTRDTPRAVDTWIYTPFRTKAQKDFGVKVWDIHLLCDHLDAIEGGARPRKNKTRLTTHRIQVITASRYLEADDSFQSKTLMEEEWDWQGRQSRRDFYALQIMDAACKTLLVRKADNFDWTFEFEMAARQIMGAAWDTQANRRPKPDSPAPDFITGIDLDGPGGRKIVRFVVKWPKRDR